MTDETVYGVCWAVFLGVGVAVVSPNGLDEDEVGAPGREPYAHTAL